MIGEKIAILDLGTYKLKLLIISLDKDNFIDVHAKYSIFSSGIKKGNVTDIEKLSSTIKHCVASIEKEMNINIRDIYVGINSIDFNFLTFCLTRNIGSYEIEEKKDLQNLIDLASGIFFQNLNDNKIIHFLNSGFYLDKKNHVENPIGLRSKTLDINFSFLSLEKNIISNFNKVFKKAGLRVKRYFYSPFASSILSSDQQVLEKGFINLDFGYDKTSITLFENSKLIFSKSIPIGSYHINNDLMKSIDLDKNLAEKIKCNYDKILNGEIDHLIKSHLENRRISLDIVKKIIDARIDETLDFIYKNISFCRALNTSARKIILTGGGADLKVFQKKISENLSTSVDFAKQSFPVKNTEFNVFSDYMVCLGIAKLIFFPNKDEIKSFIHEKKGFFNKFYSLFLK
tara:strand:- start:9575 stop:10777 length:1203 start_codon:yes stop_codon:yes gene_type:complete